MTRSAAARLTLLAATGLLVAPLLHGQAVPPALPNLGDANDFIDVYRVAVGNWIAVGQKYVTGLFAVIAAADLAWFGIEFWLNRSDFEGMMMATVRKIFAIGFFLALVLNVTTWFPDIINGFIQLGKEASPIKSLGPSSMLAQGANIAGTILQSASPFIAAAPALGLGYFIGAAGVLGAFCLIALQFGISLIDSYVAIGLGSYFIWLGGSRWTVSYVERYFAFCVAVGVKLLALYLLIGVGWTITDRWKAEAASNTGPINNILNGWVIAIGALFFAFLCWHCSKLVSSVLGGSPTLTGSDAVAFFGSIASAGLAAAATVASGGAGLLAGSGAAAGSGVASAGRAAVAPAGARLGSGAGGIYAGLSVPPVPQPSPPTTPPSRSGGSGEVVFQPNPPGMGAVETGLRAGQQIANGARNLPPSGNSGGTPQSPIGH